MFSVIIPIYQVEKYIEACIRAILCQTYRKFEVIVVDDGSPDCSAEIASNLLQQYADFPFRIIHTENRGVSAARNLGLEYACGKYVIMVDSDDVISPMFLQEYAEMITREPDLDIYSSSFCVMDENCCDPFSTSQAKENLLSWDEAQLFFLERKIRFLLPTLMISRAFLEENSIRFDEAVRYSEDVQFIWRCLAYNRKHLLHSEKKMYHYILHPGSTMTSSGISKILTCCEGVARLYEETGELFCTGVRKQLIARTYFAMLHGAAKMMSMASFCQLYEQACCESLIREVSQNAPLKIWLVAKLLLVSKKLGYLVMRKF